MSKNNFGFSRRDFVRTSIIAGISINIPWISACSNEFIIPNNLKPLNESSFLDMRSLLDVLFPQEGNGPGALNVNSDTYILWVLNDENIDFRENKYLIKNLKKFSNYIISVQGERFFNLTYSKQKDFVNDIVRLKWGDIFFSRVLTLIFESLLIHPLYKVNSNEVAWKWLKHHSGFPFANEELAYPQILDKVK